MLEPYEGRVFDPCCGSGGMFVQSEKFIQAHGGRLGSIAIYGQESNQTTWRLCKMNLAIRGIDANIQWANSFHNDAHKDLKADVILANPPFNDSDWGGEALRDDIRWKFGTPPKGNANFAWVQHFIYHLSPSGTAGFVLSNGSMSSNTSGEGEIRKNIIEADLVDCMVALPGQLFYNTAIPTCLWFIAREKSSLEFRDRRNELLFVDARNKGTMVDRRHRELTSSDLKMIASVYHEWRSKKGKYENVPGFCQSAYLEEIRKNGYVLTPGRYVKAAKEQDDEPFEETMQQLTSQLSQLLQNSKKLDDDIRKSLSELGYEI
jgi:type I restriction enzyme M protein